MHGALKKYWMHALGTCLIVGAAVFWARLQGTPRYVALRGANSLYEGGSFESLPLHEGELKELGMSKDKACQVLERIRGEYLQDARIASSPTFRQQPGKDVLAFQVEVRPGTRVRSVVEVIDENGRGVVMFGDLVASMRATLFYEAESAVDAPAKFAALNGISDLLVAEGVPGYWDMATNRLTEWPRYSEKGERF